MKEYKITKSFEERKKESEKVLIKYPDRIPVIIQKYHKSGIKDIERNKFLVPNDVSLSHLITIVRQMVKLNHTEALFVLINNEIPSSTEIMSQIYKKYKDKDGFLYIYYQGENAFGF